MTIRTSRLAALATAPLLAIGVLAAAAPAQAAPNSYAYSAARWLDDQLTDGLAPSQFGGGADYGLSIDVFFTLHDLETRPTTQARIISALRENVDNYTTGEAFGDANSRYAGPTGKLAAAVAASGGDITDVGGKDLQQLTEQRVTDEGDEAGRAVDASAYGDNSNTIGQSWVVRALQGAGSSEAGAAVGYLLKQQCPSGAFRSNMYAEGKPDDPSTDYPDAVAPVDRTCGDPTTADDDVVTNDATAFAILALADVDSDAARTAVAKAVKHLVDEQAADGSFSNDGAPNTNTTGLAASALAAAGRTGAAGSAAAWIVDKQATDANAEDTKLANETGAIAYDADALAEGRVSGIEDGADRDRWIRATAQAAAGVNFQLPRKTLTVSAPTKYFAASTPFTATVGGLEPGEKFTVRHGSTVRRGTADATGKGSVSITSASRTTNVTITATGARTARAGEAVIKVLARKTLGVSASSTSVKRGGTTTVKVTGLAASEPVRIRYRSKTVSSGQATASGTYTYTLKVGTVTGKKTVYAFGKFDNRTGTRGVTVK